MGVLAYAMRCPTPLAGSFVNGGGTVFSSLLEKHGRLVVLELTMDQVDRVRHGHRVPAVEEVPAETIARAVSEEGRLVALVEYDPEAHEWQPRKVFFQ